MKNYTIKNIGNNNIKTVPSYDYKKSNKKTVYAKKEIKPYVSKNITTKVETTNNSYILKINNISIVYNSYIGKNGNNNNSLHIHLRNLFKY